MKIFLSSVGGYKLSRQAKILPGRCQENNNSSDFIKIKYFCKIRYSKIKKKTVKIKQQTEIKCLQYFHQRFRTQNVRRACRTTTMATKGRERKQERERKNKEWAKKKKKIQAGNL